MSNNEQVNENTTEESPKASPVLKLGLAIVMLCFTCIYLYSINKGEEILPDSYDTLDTYQLAQQIEQTNHVI